MSIPILTEPLRDAGLTVIRREPDLYGFLQCHLSLPPSPDALAPLKQALITALCGQLRGQ